MRVEIFEVGARDGLQNEKAFVPTAVKAEFISKLSQAGIRNLEVGLFVRPDRVPQMADSDKICAMIRAGKIKLKKETKPWSLVPNRKGLERALAGGVTNIAVFTAATESFAHRNIGMSIKDSLTEFKAVVREGKRALGSKLKVRGYVSTVFGCPFEGKVSPKKALKVVEGLADLGCDQISLGDTIGVATPNQIQAVMAPALFLLGEKMVAGHFHDTRGMAVANSLRAIDIGVRTLDSSAGGLGGCPFAPGATGNVATEDLVYLLNGLGIETGIDLKKLSETSLWLAKKMKRPLVSRVLQAYAAKR